MMYGRLYAISAFISSPLFSIAWVARRNGVPCLVLRAVSDLVDGETSEAYGNYAFFEAQCGVIMGTFAHYLPGWIEAFRNDGGRKTEDR